jgi:uncharacterized protein YraI
MKLNINRRLFWTLSVIAITFFGLQSCTPANVPGSQPVVTITFPPTQTATFVPTSTQTRTQAPTVTQIIQLETTPFPTATLQPKPISAIVAVDVLNLRQGPGTTFEIIAKLQENSEVTILSRAQGSEWVELETENNESGWVSLDFLSFEAEIAVLPQQTIDFAQTVTGSVMDETGKPIESITIAVYQESDPQTNRTDARTTADGSFYAYLPLDAQSRWRVEIVGIGCSSNIVDDNCDFFGKFEPVGYEIELPVSRDALKFVYITPQE